MWSCVGEVATQGGSGSVWLLFEILNYTQRGGED